MSRADAMARIRDAMKDPYTGGIWEGKVFNQDPFATVRLADLDGLVKERDELQYLCDTRFAADRRATQRWRNEAPGRDLTWPDHADMVVWLLEKLEQAEGRKHEGWARLLKDGRILTVDELETLAIHNALSLNGGNMREAAKSLGIGRSTIYRKCSKIGA